MTARGLRALCLAPGLVVAVAIGGELHAQADCSQAHLRSLVPPDAPDRVAFMSPQLFSVFGDTPKGIGHLHPRNPEDFDDRWDSRIVLPVYSQPAGSDDQPFGWIMSGRVVQPGRATSDLSYLARRIQVDPAAPSYLVQERREDGWISLLVNAGDTGVWWTHECLFELGDVPLRYTPMQEAMTSDMYVDEPGTHVLRAAPSDSSDEVVSFSGGLGNHLMTRLEIDGDWIRVRLEVHGYRCAGEAPWQGVESWEGWVRWRGTDGLPRLASIASIC